MRPAASRSSIVAWLLRHFHGLRQSTRWRPSTQTRWRSGPNGQPHSSHPLVSSVLFVVAALVAGTMLGLGVSVILLASWSTAAA